MSKFSDVSAFESGIFSYNVGSINGVDQVAKLEVDKMFPNLGNFSKLEFAAAHFAVKTAARNARAAIKATEVKEALEAVQARFKAWLAGEWRSASESTGESHTSLLVRAVAEVLKITPDQAVELINDVVSDAVEEAGLSYDEEADKSKIRKIRSDKNAELRSVKLVDEVILRLQAEEAAKKFAAAQTRTTPDTGPSIEDLVKR